VFLHIVGEGGFQNSAVGPGKEVWITDYTTFDQVAARSDLTMESLKQWFIRYGLFIIA